jgi:hypothetical protein
MSGLNTLVHAPFNYKKGKHATLKGKKRLPQTQLRLSILKLPQQSNTQWSRVLRSGGPNHSKSSRVHVLDVRLAGQVNRLSPFLILGFRAGALCHPAGEFSPIFGAPGRGSGQRIPSPTFRVVRAARPENSLSDGPSYGRANQH